MEAQIQIKKQQKLHKDFKTRNLAHWKFRKNQLIQ